MTAPDARIGLLAQEDPPPKSPNSRRGITAEVEALIPQLRGRRGEWFLVGEFPTQSTASTVAKKLRAKYDGKLDAESRKPAKGRSCLWLRWVGARHPNTGGDR